MLKYLLQYLLLACVTAAASSATAAVFQCVDVNGHMLLTDSPCPEGYQSKLVVPEPAAPAIGNAEELARLHAEAGRAAAEAEVARLRQQLDDQRAQNSAERDHLRALDDKVDALQQQQPDYGLTFIGPPIWTSPRALPPCADGVGRPWVDCRPRPPRADGHGVKGAARHDRQPASPDPCGTFGCTPSITGAHGAGTRERAPSALDPCGTFGCTPGITRAPWDDERRDRRSR